MSKVCQITGKKVVGGSRVSHSNHKTKRKFHINFFRKKMYWVEKGCWITLGISSSGLRIINKIGLDLAIKQSQKKNVDFIIKDGKKSKGK